MATQTLFDRALEDALSTLSDRSATIVRQRFGIGYSAPRTLDAIGKDYDITRERVRQIIRSSIATIRERNDSVAINHAHNSLKNHIISQGGIVHLERLVRHFQKTHHITEPVLRFFIALSEEIFLLEKHHLYPLTQAVHVQDFDFATWQQLHKDVYAYLQSQNRVCTHDDVYAFLRQTHKNIDSVHAAEQLHISTQIKQNAFGRWGIVHWKSVTPKSISDKAFLILEEAKKPMHFREIAQAIDARNLGKGHKKTHPQTVHNALIKEKEFVLVGRGLYGLASKRHIPGTVRDVIVAILTEAKRPLTDEEIIKHVLSQRAVKVSTIRINLHAVAKKDGNTYTLK